MVQQLEHNQRKIESVQDRDAPAIFAEGAIEVPRSDQVLLAEIAMEAVNQQLNTEARKIFDALAIIRPGHGVATVGYAYIAYMDDQYDKAIELLVDPEFSEKEGWFESLGLLLLCYWFGGYRDKATGLARQLLNGPDSPGKQVAVDLADDMER